MMRAVVSTAFSVVGREPLEIAWKSAMLLGLRSAFCYVDDIAAARLWYTKVLGFPPYFDQPFYVGFNVGGFELGLSPDGGPDRPAPGNTPRAYGAYWGVKDIKSAYARLLELGAAPRGEIQDVGEGILIADVLDPWGNVFGIIENPHFSGLAPTTENAAGAAADMGAKEEASPRVQK